MIDEELLDLCKQSIKERIECLKTMSFGMGYGITTQLKRQIAELTELDFEHIRYAINSFDQINNWDHKDLSCEKWDMYADFMCGCNENPPTYYIEEYGYLLQQYLLKWVRKVNECVCDKPNYQPYSDRYICHNGSYDAGFCDNELKWKKDKND